MTSLVVGKHIFGLAHAASSYHKVLEENRKLYNQVQDLKGKISSTLDLTICFYHPFLTCRPVYASLGSIRVYCRVRPFLPGQLSSNTVGSIDDGNITIITPLKFGKEGRRSFSFNKVFGPSASQGC